MTCPARRDRGRALPAIDGHPSLVLEAGMTLVEVLVAVLVASVGALALAQLFWMATADNVTAAQDSVATILASQKMEELRTPVLPGALGVSPAGTLETSVPGFVDHVGADGLVVGTASTPPGTAVFTRRWAIEPLPAAGAGAVLVRVIVMPSRRGGPRRPAWGGGQPGTSRVASILDRAVP